MQRVLLRIAIVSVRTTCRVISLALFISFALLFCCTLCFLRFLNSHSGEQIHLSDISVVQMSRDDWKLRTVEISKTTDESSMESIVACIYKTRGLSE